MYKAGPRVVLSSSGVYGEREVGGGRRRQVSSELGHREGACAHPEADALRSEVAIVAAAAVDVPIRTVVQVRRVERTVALAAAEAPLVPHAVLRDHLLSGVHRVAAARATVTVVSLLADLGLGVDAAKGYALRSQPTYLGEFDHWVNGCTLYLCFLCTYVCMYVCVYNCFLF